MASFNSVVGQWTSNCGHGFSSYGQAESHESSGCAGTPMKRRATIGFDRSQPSTWPRKGETAVWRIINNLGMRLVERVLDQDWKDMSKYVDDPARVHVQELRG